LLAQPCRGDLYTLTFNGLNDGQSLTTYTTQGFQFFDPSGFTAIGPGNPNYLGTGGLHPLGNDFLITRTDGSSFTVGLLGFSFGLLASSGEIDTDTFGIASGATKYIIAMDTTNGLNPDAPQNPLPPVDTLRVSFANSVPAFQVTEVRLDVESAVPEPSALVIVVLAAPLLIGYAWLRRR
jgi:hypothetical protein